MEKISYIFNTPYASHRRESKDFGDFILVLSIVELLKYLDLDSLYFFEIYKSRDCCLFDTIGNSNHFPLILEVQLTQLDLIRNGLINSSMLRLKLIFQFLYIFRSLSQEQYQMNYDTLVKACWNRCKMGLLELDDI